MAARQGPCQIHSVQLNRESMETPKPTVKLRHVFLVLCYLLCVQTSYFVESKTCRNCDQGKCVDDSCVCLPGWIGPQCDKCYGRVGFNQGREGIIYDGAANYSINLSCSWLLEADEDNMRLHLYINGFATECVWDHLYVHDGDSAFAPVLAAFSGVLSGAGSKPDFKFQLSGRYAFIHLYSDAAFTLNGFNISYVLDDCALECSENAVCNNSVCQCNPGWSGEFCNVLDEGCPNNCSGHGTCLLGVCQCNDSYSGVYCSEKSGDLQVEALHPITPAALVGRASSCMVVDDARNLWVFGGYRMWQPANDSSNIFSFNTLREEWTVIEERGVQPWPRYGHSCVFYENSVYLFGGVSNTKIMNDLWRYNINTNTWTELPSGPRYVSGHTAHAVNNAMVVIFGYSPVYGYSNKVLEYDFITKNWTIVTTIGSLVHGGYGHASVYDTVRKVIFVYGGYHSYGSKNYNLTDKLYEYDPIAKKWFILHNSGSPRYLHTAAMMNGLLVTFGGNTHNDTRVEHQAKCFSPDVKIYDRDCNAWHTLPPPSFDPSFEGLERFGHSMVSIDNEIYMFGGYNSFMLNDLMKISAGKCTYYQDKESCEIAIPGVKCRWSLDACIEHDAKSGPFCAHDLDPNQMCSGYNTCESCSAADCHWCGKTCIDNSLTGSNCSVESGNCTKDTDTFCSLFHKCEACKINEECIWHGESCIKADLSDKDSAVKKETSKCAEHTCSQYTACGNCTKASCMWCSNLNQCIDTMSYVVSFHYGQCMDWTTREVQCEENACSRQKTCKDCQSKPKCGWCDDESGTGMGICMDGSMTGPIKFKEGKPQVDLGVCPAQRWFFNECPKCQCNGHSICLNDTDICANCTFPVIGTHCEHCADGYYGKPENNGTCEACFCNDQADTCNPVTGDCFCRTRGVIGKTCDRCDNGNKYIGDPKNGGTCYYQVSTDFQYTFNLSKDEDKYYTQINFINIPTASDRDVDFTLNCSSRALINITYKSRSDPEEKEYVSFRECTIFRTKFEHKNYAFGGKENTTFQVYIFDLQTPFKLQISFSQFPKIDLVHFFVTFFSCFLSLLLIAAALWKIKHKYDSYRRRQQLMVEMQQMASRPFSTILVDIERKSDPVVLDKKDHLDSVLRRRKKTGNKPSSIALEPLVDNKAAILTLIVQLPSGNSDYAPSGQSGLALGSALVSIGSNRKQSVEHMKGEKPKIKRNLSSHPDTCA